MNKVPCWVTQVIKVTFGDPGDSGDPGDPPLPRRTLRRLERQVKVTLTSC